ncbi:MAG TPA: hypothetical protein DCR40_08420 [Prolixibacteraceae bacterium]|nr:hypothetical protein [Prolixibacteraceae bacterium]
MMGDKPVKNTLNIKGMWHHEMEKIVGFILILAGFSCYFIASKINVEFDNRIRLIDHGENESMFEKKSLFIYILGFMLCSFGLFGCGAVKPYLEEGSYLEFIGFLMVCFYNVVFVWFNVMIANKYFHRISILGKWIVGKHEIVFERSDFNGHYGEYNIIDYTGISVESYKFSCEVDYKRREIRFVWLDIDWEKKEDLPIIVYFGNGSCFVYKMTTFKTTSYYLLFEHSIGWMKKQ